MKAGMTKINVSKKGVLKFGIGAIIGTGVDKIVWGATKMIMPESVSKAAKITYRVGAFGISTAMTKIVVDELCLGEDEDPIISAATQNEEEVVNG